jgi:multiple sugar transport system substrate-binding protein
VAANVGGGPDIILGWYDDAHLYPDKLVPLTDVAEYLGRKYGGWYDVCRDYGMRGKEWIALPIGANGGAMVYRESHVKAAGFEAFPTTTDDYLKLAQALKRRVRRSDTRSVMRAATRRPGATGSYGHTAASSWTGRTTSRSTAPRRSPRSNTASSCTRRLIPGTLSWLDPSNNKAFLDGQISVTNNAISIYYVAKNSSDEKLKAMAQDIQHAGWPIGPVGKSTELHQITQAMVFKHTQYPKAAKEVSRFMMEKDQYEPWQTASIGYVMQPLKAYENGPIWTMEPKAAAFRTGMARMRHHGYAGQLGYASAGAIADFIIVDMVAEAASGDKSPKEAAERAQKRAERYYKV